MTGKMLDPKLGKVQFWLLFVGFHMTFLVQHWTGVQGQVRRTANYPDLPGDVTTLNVISTAGYWILVLSILLFMWNVYVTSRFGDRVDEDDPWGFCSSLEWATPARRRGTTSTGFRASAPSARRSTCTTRGC